MYNLTDTLMSDTSGKNGEAVETSSIFRPSEAVISNHALRVVEIVLDLFLTSALAMMGVVTNILDILVFSKIGFQDSVNISMTTIAMWDLAKCCCALVTRVHLPLGLVSEAEKLSWRNICTPTLVYAQVLASYVSYVLAAYVSVERCLCVCIPFKVKTLLTPRTTFIVMIVLSGAVSGLFAVIFFYYDIRWRHSDEFNRTIAVFEPSTFFLAHYSTVITYFNIFGLINPVGSFIVIVGCTIIIVIRLKTMSRVRSGMQIKTKEDFRPGGAGEKNGGVNMGERGKTGEKGEMSYRDRQVMKMLLMVILVYIITLVPRFIHHVGKFLEPEFYYLQKYHNLFQLSVYVSFTSDFINASVNFFIFLSMSSNFRATFYEIFPHCRPKNSKT